MKGTRLRKTIVDIPAKFLEAIPFSIRIKVFQNEDELLQSLQNPVNFFLQGGKRPETWKDVTINA